MKDLEEALASGEGSLSNIAREADEASRGALSSFLLFVFGVALVAVGQSLIRSSVPVVAYIVLAELVFAGFVQEGETIVRHGLMFSAGVAIGLIIGRDWWGLAISMSIYLGVTALRFSRHR